MGKPDFEGERRQHSQALPWGAGNLTPEQYAKLAEFIPTRWFDSKTSVLGETDGRRLIRGVDEAIGWFDAMGATTAIGSALERDLEAIGNAAKELLRAIRSADKAARTTIDFEAVQSVRPRDKGRRAALSRASAIAVHWSAALEDSVPHDVLAAIEAGGYLPSWTCSASFLSALWDMATDATALTKLAASQIEKAPNNRVDRINAAKLARKMVSDAASELGYQPGRHVQMGRPLPVSPWVADLIAEAASFRDVTIGRKVALDAVRDYASRHKDQCRRSA